MMAPRALLGAALVSWLLGGCGPSSTAPIAAKADVIITVDGPRHSCVVALYKEAQGSLVPCADVVPFLRDELRLHGGSIYDIRAVPQIDATEMARLGASLKGAGYRFIGGRADPFSSEPRKDP